MVRETYSEKLIRDLIAERMRAKGEECRIRRVRGRLDRHVLLLRKFQEEWGEYRSATSGAVLEEIGDIQEVVYGLALFRGFPRDEFIAALLEKRVSGTPPMLPEHTFSLAHSVRGLAELKRIREEVSRCFVEYAFALQEETFSCLVELAYRVTLLAGGHGYPAASLDYIIEEKYQSRGGFSKFIVLIQE